MEKKGIFGNHLFFCFRFFYYIKYNEIIQMDREREREREGEENL